ncbi:MAG TPA: hypothetical protein VFM05_00985 [Candidatus Saccharimonadales bacterium]|nr:hypothetical protein [Candidatus Saccharimonadales bacterium]
MSDIKQTVTRTEEEGVDNDGASVQQQTKRIQTETATDTKTVAENLVWYILGFIEILLGLRFVLKLFGANPDNPFVDLVYAISGVLTAPFDNIFNVATATAGEVRSVFEPSILVAMAIYALLAWGIVKLITINQKQ